MFSESYNTLRDLIREFPSDEACRKLLENIRWGDEEGNILPVCPHCEHSEKVYAIESGKRFKCSACRKKFTVTVGTYHHISRKHMQRYANESAFRLNTREMNEGERFNITLANCEGSLKCAELTPNVTPVT
jgi:hypothetical protein